MSLFKHRTVASLKVSVETPRIDLRLPGKCTGSSKVGFVTSRFLETFRKANDYFEMIHFRETVESKTKKLMQIRDF